MKKIVFRKKFYFKYLCNTTRKIFKSKVPPYKYKGRKQQIKSNASRRKKIIKVRAEIIKIIRRKKIIEKSMKLKISSLINNDRSLLRSNNNFLIANIKAKRNFYRS